MMRRTPISSKTVTVSLTIVLLGLFLVSSQTLASIGFIPLLPEAEAQQFDDEVEGEERADLVVRDRPLPDPELDDPNLRVETVFRGLEFPTAMAFLGEDDILVTEKDSGIVQRIVDGELQEEPVIDVAVANNNMRGLLGIAVSHSNGTGTDNEVQYVFLYFTESGGGEDGDDWREGIPPEGNRLYRYNIASENGDNNDQIQLVDETLILDLPATPGPRFNGGPVAIGPDDNVYVIIGTVDHRATQAQNVIDGPEPDGSSGVIRNTQEGEIEDIPGVISDDVPLNLYYAYGIRSSFGMAFDPVTGNLWDTENGPECCDEINLVEPGFNSGWAKVSGLAERQDNFDIEDDLVDFDGRGEYSDPKFVWHDPVSPTGLAFLDSSRLGAEYQDDLFVGDFNFGRLYHFKLNEDRTELDLRGDLADRVLDRGDEFDDILFGTGFGGITDIKVGPDGHLYVLAFHSERGTIFKIVSDDEEREEREADDEEREEREADDEEREEREADDEEREEREAVEGVEEEAVEGVEEEQALEEEVESTEPLTVQIISNATEGVAPATFEFEANIAGGTEPYTISWNFDDGEQSDEQTVLHTFEEAGTYNVTLTTTDTDNQNASDSIEINVEEPPPPPTTITEPLTAEIISNATEGVAPAIFEFEANVTGGTEPYTYIWNFDDGSEGSDEETVLHTFEEAGTYNVTLTTTDTEDQNASDSIEINVEALPVEEVEEEEEANNDINTGNITQILLERIMSEFL